MPIIRSRNLGSPFLLGKGSKGQWTERIAFVHCAPQTEEQAEDAPEPVKGSLNRAQSAQAISAAAVPAREDGLKRVCSEPLLSAQGKGVLLKRKLSLLEQDVIINEDNGRNKLKKQGGKALPPRLPHPHPHPHPVKS